MTRLLSGRPAVLRATRDATWGAVLPLLASAAAVAAEAEHAQGGLPQLNPANFASQIFWALVMFALLYVLMSKVALPRVAEVIEDRNRLINQDLERAAAMQQEAETALATYEKALADARTQAQAIIRTVNEEIARTTADTQAALAADLIAQTRDAEERIAAARQTALQQVRVIATEAAQAAASRLAGTEIDTARIDAAVQAAAQDKR